MTTQDKSKFLNNSNHLNHSKKASVKDRLNRKEYINSRLSNNLSNYQENQGDKSALVFDTSPDPNYNEIEQFIKDRLKEGYDPIDALILARESFDNRELDDYLYEMRSKGII